MGKIYRIFLRLSGILNFVTLKMKKKEETNKLFQLNQKDFPFFLHVRYNEWLRYFFPYSWWWIKYFLAGHCIKKITFTLVNMQGVIFFLSYCKWNFLLSFSKRKTSVFFYEHFCLEQLKIIEFVILKLKFLHKKSNTQSFVLQ